MRLNSQLQVPLQVVFTIYHLFQQKTLGKCTIFNQRHTISLGTHCHHHINGIVPTVRYSVVPTILYHTRRDVELLYVPVAHDVDFEGRLACPFSLGALLVERVNDNRTSCHTLHDEPGCPLLFMLRRDKRRKTGDNTLRNPSYHLLLGCWPTRVLETSHGAQ